MKRSKNYTWLVIGIIVILAGILVPIFAFNQSAFYEVKKDTHAGNITFFITVTSEDEIKDINNAIVEVSYDNADNKEFEVYYIKSVKVDDKYTYEFKLVETTNWVFADDIESVKLSTNKGIVEIEEKLGWGTRIPIIVFSCLIGAFMIFVNFFNNNSKNRTIELKEIIASSYNEIPMQQTVESDLKEEEVNNSETEEVKNEPQSEQTKVCEYCGTLSDINEKVCESCGAKFKKLN